MTRKPPEMIGPLSINGETKSLYKWAEHYNIPFQTLYRRWRKGERTPAKLFAPPVYSRIKTTTVLVGELPIERKETEAIKITTPKNAVQAGDWIRYQSTTGFGLLLAIVEYVVGDKIHTTSGAIELDSILEIRRCQI